MEPNVPPIEGGFATRAVGASLAAAPPAERPVSPAIWPAVAWSTDASSELGDLLTDERDGYVYGRYDNPTNTALHAVVASLHGAEAAWSMSSGTAAINAALAVLGRGGTILAADRLYGGTFAQLERMRRDAGWEVEYAPVEEIATRLDDHHSLVYAETIANPTTAVTDIAALAAVADDAGVPLVVDNTFASPYLCRPLELGATLVVESATKYLGGHGDVVAGVVAGARDLVRRLREHTYELGSSLGPWEAWLVARGIQTLPLRMRTACDNASAIAEALREAGAEDVRYPGLADHPDHELAGRQFGGRGHGAIVALDLGDRRRAEAFADACQVITRATSLGATRSLVLHPASTSHRQLSRDELDAAGIGPGTVRIAAGIEDRLDLTADVRRALAVAAAAPA